MTPGRSGSEMLCRFIGEQPGVTMYPEIYHPAFINKYASDGTAIQDLRDKPSIYMDMLVAQSKDAKLVGGKVIFGEVDERIINRIIDDEKTAIVLLYRQNLLQMAVSSVIAGRLGQWHIFKESERVTLPERLYIDPLDIHGQLIMVEHITKALHRWLSGRQNWTDICYEDLSNLTALNWVLTFLNLEPVQLFTPKTIKQTGVDYYNKIKNVDELEERFGGTYGSLFEDIPPAIWREDTEEYQSI